MPTECLTPNQRKFIELPHPTSRMRSHPATAPKTIKRVSICKGSNPCLINKHTKLLRVRITQARLSRVKVSKDPDANGNVFTIGWFSNGRASAVVRRIGDAQ